MACVWTLVDYNAPFKDSVFGLILELGGATKRSFNGVFILIELFTFNKFQSDLFPGQLVSACHLQFLHGRIECYDHTF